RRRSSPGPVGEAALQALVGCRVVAVGGQGRLGRLEAGGGGGRARSGRLLVGCLHRIAVAVHRGAHDAEVVAHAQGDVVHLPVGVLVLLLERHVLDDGGEVLGIADDGGVVVGHGCLKAVVRRHPGAGVQLAPAGAGGGLLGAPGGQNGGGREGHHGHLQRTPRSRRRAFDSVHYVPRWATVHTGRNLVSYRRNLLASSVGYLRNLQTQGAQATTWGVP